MIPTKLQKILKSQFGIDLYSTFSSSILDKLQHQIVSAIDTIKQSIANQGQDAMIAVVSNANNRWIHEYFDANENELISNKPKLSILSFVDNLQSKNWISIHTEL